MSQPIRGLSTLCLLFTLIVASPLWATRPYISLEEKSQRTPLLFEGTITKVEEVDAPTNDAYLYDQTKALAITLELQTLWKGNLPTTITMYTWPLGKAPCSGVTANPGDSYIVWAGHDSTETHILFDFCGGWLPSSALDAPRIRQKLDRLFKP